LCLSTSFTRWSRGPAEVRSDRRQHSEPAFLGRNSSASSNHPGEYRSLVEKDRSLEPGSGRESGRASEDEAIQVLEGVRERYEKSMPSAHR